MVDNMDKATFDRLKEETHAAHAKKVGRNAAIRQRLNLPPGEQIPPQNRYRPDTGHVAENYKGGRRNRRLWGIRRTAKAGYRKRQRLNVSIPREQQPWATTSPEV
ncbi:hypothetical protein SEA_AIKOY__103 [Mycobacterium phage Aikoy]|nr:hypothetical protein SEA_AIKOY__103 [Mycobacterium phage Aikoy]